MVIHANGSITFSIICFFKAFDSAVMLFLTDMKQKSLIWLVFDLAEGKKLCIPNLKFG